MKNVKLSYILTFLHYSWFWLGTWAIYYSSFGGNYAIGLLETIMIVTTILAEIPTGAIGDLLGKKKTLIMGYFIMGMSNIWMGFAPDLFQVALSLFVLNIGGAFVSGTFNALIYDSLKEEKKAQLYPKILSNITSITFFAYGFFSIIGGYISEFDLRMPYILNGIFTLVGSFVALYLVEPAIDTEKMTIKKYINQNINGAKHIFRNMSTRKIVLPLLLISSIVFILRQGIDDILMLDFGFKDKPLILSILVAGMMLLAAAVSHFYPKFVKGYKNYSNFLLLTLISAVTLIISPFTFLYFGAFTVLIRSLISPLMDTYTSYKVNQVVESKYRATALSTFSMIQGIPYALTIFWVTSITDLVPSSYVAFFFGIVFFVFIFFKRKQEPKLEILGENVKK